MLLFLPPLILGTIDGDDPDDGDDDEDGGSGKYGGGCVGGKALARSPPALAPAPAEREREAEAGAVFLT